MQCERSLTVQVFVHLGESQKVNCTPLYEILIVVTLIFMMYIFHLSVGVYLHLPVDVFDLLLASELQRERALLVSGLRVVNSEMPN